MTEKPSPITGIKWAETEETALDVEALSVWGRKITVEMKFERILPDTFDLLIGPDLARKMTPIYYRLLDEHYPCGARGHVRSWWEDEQLGLLWCPDCGTEIHLGAKS